MTDFDSIPAALADPRNLLVATVFLPLAGALVIWFIADRGRTAIRQSALVTSLMTAAMAGILIARFAPGSEHLRPGQDSFAMWEIPWLGGQASLDIWLRFGLDGLSLWLFGLSALLTVTAVLVSWEAIGERPAAFYGMLLLLETGMLGVFAARDILLFYVFFEFTLIPLYFLIGIWGSEERRWAAQKFFLFTLAGSLLTFLGLLAIVLWVAGHPPQPGSPWKLTFLMQDVTNALAIHPLPTHWQLVVFGALFAGFAVKVPLFPLHTWLPLAHVQAPAAGSIILAGVLLKIGTYGFLRLSVPMLPAATAICAPWLLGLSVAGILYGALVALAQTDMKRLIAYSSVSHLGFVMLGLFALNRPGTQGSVLQMVNHGLSTGGLFALVGMIYERWHTRQIADLSGLARRTPLLAAMFVLFALSSIGLPGLNGFAGEFLILLGMFQRAWSGTGVEWLLAYRVLAVLAVAGVVLGAWYMLWLVQRVFFGPPREPHHDPHQPPVRDLAPREVLALAPLVAFIFWIGLQPQFFLARTSATLAELTAAAIEEVHDQTAPARPLAGTLPPSLHR